MCDPATLAVAAFAMTTVQTVISYQDQKDSAEAQRKMIQDGLEKDRAATQRQYEEINAVAQDDSAERHKNYLIDQARIKAIGAESGLQGNTQDRIDQENTNNANTDISTIEANRQRQAEAAHTQNLSKTSQAKVQLAGIRNPSALGAGLQIAAAGTSAYSAYKYPPKTSGTA